MSGDYFTVKVLLMSSKLECMFNTVCKWSVSVSRLNAVFAILNYFLLKNNCHRIVSEQSYSPGLGRGEFTPAMGNGAGGRGAGHPICAFAAC